MDSLKNLLEEAKNLPQSPGVYFMKDEVGNLLYIGKALSLRSRVSSYFRTLDHDSTKTSVLVSKICKFEVMLTENEEEALLLECTLIKKHKPPYNIRLKDDKTFPSIKVSMNHPYPKLEWTRKVKNDGARYFGPFPSGWAAKQIMFLLNQTLKLRDCSDHTFSHRSRPCILFQMDRCTAPCVEGEGKEGYAKQVERALEILEGKNESFLKILEEEMMEASENEDFEKAIFYRNQIENLKLISQTQSVIDFDGEKHFDAITLAHNDSRAHAVVLEMRFGKLQSLKHIQIHSFDAKNQNRENLLEEFLAQYFSREKNHEGRLILLPENVENQELLEKSFHVRFRLPESEKEHQLMRVAKTNAEYALESQKFEQGVVDYKALEELQEKLFLEKLPQRIECFDISNFQGTDSVASRVVFIDGRAEKELYRRYKIKTVEGSNDFASMKEVLSRRFSNLEEAFPDLLVVDGGRGQLSQALAIFEDLKIQGVAVVGLAKARTLRDFKSTEVESSEERVFIPNRKNPVALKSNSKSFQILTQVRDEAHRFAISYHRLLRQKRHFKKGAKK